TLCADQPDRRRRDAGTRDRHLLQSTENPYTELIRDARLVVTMGCSIEEACPKPIVAQMQKKLIEWHLEDPKGKPLGEVRKIRDEREQGPRPFDVNRGSPPSI